MNRLLSLTTILLISSIYGCARYGFDPVSRSRDGGLVDRGDGLGPRVDGAHDAPSESAASTDSASDASSNDFDGPGAVEGSVSEGPFDLGDAGSTLDMTSDTRVDTAGTSDARVDTAGTSDTRVDTAGTSDTRGDSVADQGAADLIVPLDGGSGGSFVWVDSPQRAGYGYTNAVDVDSAGNVTVSGHFSDTLDFGASSLVSAGLTDVFVASYSAGGVPRWQLRIGASNNDQSWALAVGNGGHVYVAGTVDGDVDFGGGVVAGSGATIFLASYDSGGGYRWAKRFGSGSGRSLDTDASGNVYLHGTLSGATNFGGGTLTPNRNDVYVASFASDGAFRWADSYGGMGDESAASIAVHESTGNVYVAGEFEQTVSFGSGNLQNTALPDFYLAAFDNLGTPRWSKQVDGDRWCAVAVGSSGHVAFTGSYRSTIDFGGNSISPVGLADLFVVRFDAAGNHNWTRSYGGSENDAGNSIAVAADGRIYVSGHFGGTVDFGSGACVADGTWDAFFLALNPDGSHRWASCPGLHEPRDLAVDSSYGGLYGVGFYSATETFPSGTISPPLSTAGYLLKLVD